MLVGDITRAFRVFGLNRNQNWNRGSLFKKIPRGDVIWTPPGIKHWHGGGEKQRCPIMPFRRVLMERQSSGWSRSKINLLDAVESDIQRARLSYCREVQGSSGSLCRICKCLTYSLSLWSSD